MLALPLVTFLALAAPLQDGARAPHEVRLERGREALEAGQREEAVEHLLGALGWRPASEEILTLLMRAAEPVPDEAALWAHVLATATVDHAGRSTLGREAAAAVEALAPKAEALARARAAATAIPSTRPAAVTTKLRAPRSGSSLIPETGIAEWA